MFIVLTSESHEPLDFPSNHKYDHFSEWFLFKRRLIREPFNSTAEEAHE